MDKGPAYSTSTSSKLSFRAAQPFLGTLQWLRPAELGHDLVQSVPPKAQSFSRLKGGTEASRQGLPTSTRRQRRSYPLALVLPSTSQSVIIIIFKGLHQFRLFRRGAIKQEGDLNPASRLHSRLRGPLRRSVELLLPQPGSARSGASRVADASFTR